MKKSKHRTKGDNKEETSALEKSSAVKGNQFKDSKKNLRFQLPSIKSTMNKHFKKNSSRKVTDSIKNQSEISGPGKGSISPANIDLKNAMKKFPGAHKQGLATTKHAAKKYNSNSNTTFFKSLSPINKDASPLLKNLTIEEETPQSNS